MAARSGLGVAGISFHPLKTSPSRPPPPTRRPTFDFPLCFPGGSFPVSSERRKSLRLQSHKARAHRPQKPTEILKSHTTLHTRYKSLWVSHHTDVGCRRKNPKWAEAPGKALRPHKALIHTAVQQPPPGSQTSLAQCLNTCFKGPVAWPRGCRKEIPYRQPSHSDVIMKELP